MWDQYDLAPPAQTDAPEERVLVAVVTRPADWERIQREGWYRIPLSHAPRRMAVQYLAFYHTRAFAELRSDILVPQTIRYYAPVLRFAIASRGELLPDEPDHPRAKALDYRIEIGPLLSLPRPIPSLRLRRITFILTTLPLLLRAQDVTDLWPRETARDRLWRALKMREIVAQRDYIISEGDLTYRADLAVLGPQRLAVHCADATDVAAHGDLAAPPAEMLASRGWSLEQFTVREIMTDTPGCAERIRAMLGAPASSPG